MADINKMKKIVEFHGGWENLSPELYSAFEELQKNNFDFNKISDKSYSVLDTAQASTFPLTEKDVVTKRDEKSVMENLYPYMMEAAKKNVGPFAEFLAQGKDVASMPGRAIYGGLRSAFANDGNSFLDKMGDVSEEEEFFPNLAKSIVTDPYLLPSLAVPLGAAKYAPTAFKALSPFVKGLIATGAGAIGGGSIGAIEDVTQGRGIDPSSVGLGALIGGAVPALQGLGKGAYGMIRDIPLSEAGKAILEKIPLSKLKKENQAILSLIGNYPNVDIAGKLPNSIDPKKLGAFLRNEAEKANLEGPTSDIIYEYLKTKPQQLGEDLETLKNLAKGSRNISPNVDQIWGVDVDEMFRDIMSMKKTNEDIFDPKKARSFYESQVVPELSNIPRRPSYEQARIIKQDEDIKKANNLALAEYNVSKAEAERLGLPEPKSPTLQPKMDLSEAFGKFLTPSQAADLNQKLYKISKPTVAGYHATNEELAGDLREAISSRNRDIYGNIIETANKLSPVPENPKHLGLEKEALTNPIILDALFTDGPEGLASLKQLIKAKDISKNTPGQYALLSKLGDYAERSKFYNETRPEGFFQTVTRSVAPSIDKFASKFKEDVPLFNDKFGKYDEKITNLNKSQSMKYVPDIPTVANVRKTISDVGVVRPTTVLATSNLMQGRNEQRPARITEMDYNSEIANLIKQFNDGVIDRATLSAMERELSSKRY